MPVAKITRREIEKLMPSAKPYILYDTDLKGFGVRVMPSGVSTYILEYRPDEGGRAVSKKRMAIGRTNELSPDEARNHARELIGGVRKGEDPLLERETKRKEIKVSELIDQWEKEKPVGRKSGKPMADRTRTLTLARLRHHIVPLIGSKRVSAITVDDINDVIRRVTKGETKKTEKSENKHGRILVRGGSGAARKVISDLSIVYGYAVEKKIVTDNPVNAARKPKEGKRQDYLRPDDITAIGNALDELEAEGTNIAGITILRLIMLTGARPSEIEGLKWSEVDLEGKCLRLEKSKTGYSVRPMSGAALKILKQVDRIQDSDYVFPATRGDGHFTSSQKIWNKAREKAKLFDRVRYHARHAVATLALSNGHDVASVAAIMGHKGPRTTLSTYAHVVDERAAQAAEQVGAHIDIAIRKQGTVKVISFEEKRQK